MIIGGNWPINLKLKVQVGVTFVGSSKKQKYVSYIFLKSKVLWSDKKICPFSTLTFEKINSTLKCQINLKVVTILACNGHKPIRLELFLLPVLEPDHRLLEVSRGFFHLNGTILAINEWPC